MLAAGSALAANAPPGPLDQAELKTAGAASVEVDMNMQLTAAGHRVTLRSTGVELPQRHEASLDADFSALDPSLGRERVLVIGSHAYVQFSSLQTAKARQAHIKPWIVEDVKATAGYDPWSLSSVRSLGAIKDVVAAGTGSDGGVPVHIYEAHVDLGTALELNPELAQVVARDGLGAATSSHRTIVARVDVGNDGYLHRVSESFQLPILGTTIGFNLDITLGNYNQQTAGLVAPAASQVMTLTQLQQLDKLKPATLPMA